MMFDRKQFSCLRSLKSLSANVENKSSDDE